MRRLARHRSADALSGDAGAGLVLVIGAMMVLTTMALVALAATTVSTRLSRHTQDYTAAVAAAQAGVEEFISRLNRSEAYGSVVDCTNTAWRGPMAPTSNACGWTTTTAPGWTPVVPGETDPDAARFHYSVDASRKAATGVVVLTVTGRVNGVSRTLETAVGKGGSTDYVYYTDFESADPANVQAYTPAEIAGMSTAQRNACGINGYDNALYWWKRDSAGRTRANYGCEEITFVGGDDLDGAVRTNDTIYGSWRVWNGANRKPRFQETVTTADARCQNPGTTNAQWEAACLRPSSVADFNGKTPVYGIPEYLLDTSAEFAHHPGCHYYGSTRVEFVANGTMKVWNKRSVNNNTAPVAIADANGTTPTCGTLDQLNSPGGATVPVPTGMVLYTGNSSATQRECHSGEIGGSPGRTLPLGSYTGQSLALGTTFTRDVNMAETTKTCARGNLYVEGTVRGQLTIASAESVVVTGDLVLANGSASGSPDLLGLVATNSVEVYHPRLADVTGTRDCNRTDRRGDCTSWGGVYWGTSNEREVSGWPTRYTDPTVGRVEPADGIQIAGSIQTLQHSFLVQKYAEGGSQGTLYVYGSIAQRWRGIVGSGSNGYTKKYVYDNRLRFAIPPFFPRWANSQWKQTYSGEVNTPANVRNG